MSKQQSARQEQLHLEPAGTEDTPHVWLPGVIANIARFMPANEVACSLRLINKDFSRQLRDHKHVRLSLTSPHHAFNHHWGVRGAMRSLTLRQRRQLVCLTAASGSLPNLEVAMESSGCVFIAEIFDNSSADALDSAAAAGQQEVCQWLRQRGCPWGGSLAAAAQAGHKVVCKWLLDNGCPWDDEAIYAAARGGHVGLMEWLMERKPGQHSDKYAVSLLIAAAEGCELVVLQRLHRELSEGQGGEGQGQRLDDGRIIAAAAICPTEDWQAKVEWLEGQGYRRSPETCRGAAARPDALDRLKWLRQRGYPADELSLAQAARTGNLAAVMFLLAEGFGGSRWAVHDAARGGHLAVLEALHAHGCPFAAPETATVAAMAGQLPVVAWLVETFGVSVACINSSYAAMSGSVELLSWLHEHGCEWREGTFSFAARSGCEEALEWLLDHGCRMTDDGSDDYFAAAQIGDLAMLRCLRRLGCRPWGLTGKVFTQCVRTRCALPVLRCLVEAGCPVDWDAAVQAALGGSGGNREEVLAWLTISRP